MFIYPHTITLSSPQYGFFLYQYTAGHAVNPLVTRLAAALAAAARVGANNDCQL
jgi:hypothetical protein